MAATESLMEGGHANYEKGSEKVVFELEPKTVGLTKEQLEVYRNDPVWKKIRIVLFALFWIVWAVMFAGAIAIVVLSPKCAEKQAPSWWQTKTSYQLLTPTFHDTDGDGVGDFKGIKEKLNELRKIGITTVYPSPVIAIEKNEFFDTHEVVDHLKVDHRFGTEEDFKELVDAAHDQSMYIVMDLPVSSVSWNHTWFASKDPSFFVTSKVGEAGYNNPNYYEFPGVNGTKYRGWPKQNNPVLNWENKKVHDVLLESVKKFLQLGVDGFHIDHVSQLALNADGTTNHDKSIAVLKELTGAIRSYINGNADLNGKEIVLFSSLRDVEELGSVAKETGDLHYVIDTSFAKLSQESCSDGMPKCVHQALNKAYDKIQPGNYTPFWQFSNSENSRLASRFDEPTAHLLTFMQLTLPGALSLYYGQELGLKNVDPGAQRGIMQWTPRGDDHHGFVAKPFPDALYFGETGGEVDNYETQYAEPLSAVKSYKKLAQLRQRDEALIVGETHRDALVGDVILYSRYVTHNGTVTGSAFVVALNFGEAKQDVKLYDLPSSPAIVPQGKKLAEAEISAVTPGFEGFRPRDKVDLSETPVTIGPKQGVLIRL